MDLYQNPDARPRKGTLMVPTLTTSCGRLFILNLQRYTHGCELLHLHGLPVSQHVAGFMGTPQIMVHELSHRQQCHLAGNSMHTACVGAVFCAALLFLSKA